MLLICDHHHYHRPAGGTRAFCLSVCLSVAGLRRLPRGWAGWLARSTCSVAGTAVTEPAVVARARRPPPSARRQHLPRDVT